MSHFYIIKDIHIGYAVQVAYVCEHVPSVAIREKSVFGRICYPLSEDHFDLEKIHDLVCLFFRTFILMSESSQLLGCFTTLYQLLSLCSAQFDAEELL
jgi:hypothetical protein